MPFSQILALWAPYTSVLGTDVATSSWTLSLTTPNLEIRGEPLSRSSSNSHHGFFFTVLISIRNYRIDLFTSVLGWQRGNAVVQSMGSGLHEHFLDVQP